MILVGLVFSLLLPQKNVAGVVVELGFVLPDSLQSIFVNSFYASLLYIDGYFPRREFLVNLTLHSGTALEQGASLVLFLLPLHNVVSHLGELLLSSFLFVASLSIGICVEGDALVLLQRLGPEGEVGVLGLKVLKL